MSEEEPMSSEMQALFGGAAGGGKTPRRSDQVTLAELVRGVGVTPDEIEEEPEQSCVVWKSGHLQIWAQWDHDDGDFPTVMFSHHGEGHELCCPEALPLTTENFCLLVGIIRSCLATPTNKETTQCDATNSEPSPSS